ncbi:hypothetical protein GGX14DRAFT_549925 [Mycena pura]|uniref:Endoplasmic reticulum junction formation protein lunapark n=1 Tax=Mycena pura TaxID=153505 RepID=A0AAD6VVU2_9AGAR|nr:hypothetical protein GGX14DRAFT_549925 [Mycena pura]
MSFLWRLFRAEKPPDDYETVLANLAADIQKRQILLSEIRQRERKATMLATLVTLGTWLAYLGVWYLGFVSGGATKRMRGAERALRALPVFVGPIFILFIRRIVQIWYNRNGNAEEKTLQALLKQQREKVEELKKKTNFYSTRDLLSRYDASAPQTPQRAPQTPQTGQPKSAPAPKSAQSPPAPLPDPSRRGLFDALADLLVGPDDATPASQRYALICEKCFAHNGLVPEAAWPDAQYKCPKCDHFNPSARRKRLAELAQPLPSGALPVSPVSPPPAVMKASLGPAPVASARPSVGEDMRRRSEGRRPRQGDGGGEGEGTDEMMEVDS